MNEPVKAVPGAPVGIARPPVPLVSPSAVVAKVDEPEAPELSQAWNNPGADEFQNRIDKEKKFNDVIKVLGLSFFGAFIILFTVLVFNVVSNITENKKESVRRVANFCWNRAYDEFMFGYKERLTKVEYEEIESKKSRARDSFNDDMLEMYGVSIYSQSEQDTKRIQNSTNISTRQTNAMLDRLLNKFRSEGISYPIKGELDINSRYGYRQPPMRKNIGGPEDSIDNNENHPGIDIKAYFEPCYAVSDGVISNAAFHYGGGNEIWIDHRYGFQSLYAHLKTMIVTNGQSVTNGQLIGVTGNTGKYQNGAHLHYGLYFNGEPLNPMTLFYY